MTFAIAPARAYTAIAIASLVGIPIVLALDRPPARGDLAATALGAIATLAVLVALSHRLAPSAGRILVALRALALIAMGALAAGPGWFFGPNAGFAAVIALLLALTGILSGSTGSRRPALASWLTYLALACGQAAICTLVLVRVLPDVSLTPVIVGEHHTLEHAAAHVYIQAVYLATFLAGRSFQRRYHNLATLRDEAIRTATAKAALLAQARQTYREALATTRRKA